MEDEGASKLFSVVKIKVERPVGFGNRKDWAKRRPT
jgi:hypothetical protein